MATALVVIGTSLGGLNALEVLLAGLLPTFTLPIAVVQHRSADPDGALLAHLRRFCSVRIEEVEDKQPIAPGCVYLAPASYHLLVDGSQFALATEAPVCHARPSIDVLFDSAAICYRERLAGVILTGASKDGAAGARALKDRGGLLLVQDPQTAENSTMPAAALEAATADHILTLPEIAQHLNRLSTEAESASKRSTRPIP